MLTLKEVLSRIGTDITKQAKTNLENHVTTYPKTGRSVRGKYATGNLVNNLNYVVKKTDGQTDLTFDMPAHWENVEEGRSGDDFTAYGGKQPGKFVPKLELEQWMKTKGIDLKFAYVINRSIKENGIQPTFFFSKAFEKFEPEMDKALDEYIEDDIDLQLGDL